MRFSLHVVGASQPLCTRSARETQRISRASWSCWRT